MAKTYTNPIQKYTRSNPKLAAIVLRLGLAFVFAYAAISALQTPEAWLSYIPKILTDLLRGNEALHILSVIQLALAIWLLTGKYVKLAATVAVLLLAGVILSNIASMLIVFRDVGLLCMAAALFFLA